MNISQNGIDLIKHFESFQPKAYICPTGHLTTGYGHVIGEGEDHLKIETLTKEQAEELLMKDLENYIIKVQKLVGRDLNQNQFSALVSFAYNCGLRNLQNSTLLKLVKINPEDAHIEDQFKKWVYGDIDGKMEILPGLQRRRASEAILYNTGLLKLY